MAITISRAEIKRKCMIPAADTSHDGDVDALIAEMKPSIEFTISETYLNDTGNTGLQALLKLGVLEIISGEYLQQLYRETGASESLKMGGITLGERAAHGAMLIAQGTARLEPYRKTLDAPEDDARIGSSTIGTERTFTDDSMRGW